jgi:type VI secretion system protein ImpJ
MAPLIHWHEGLFLRPQHLQLMQRQMLENSAIQRRLAWPYPYGVAEARLSATALENLLVQFDRLHVIMPSGLYLRVPENAELPAASIKDQFEASSRPFTVYLAVPLWSASRANVVETVRGEDWRAKRLYRTAETERPDENTGEDLQAITVRRINARLLFDGDDQSDMEVLPLLSVAHATGEEVGLPREDPTFAPPCFVLEGSPVLRSAVRDLVNQVEASRQELVVQITRGGFSVETMRGVQFEQMLRLRTLNRFSGRLPHLLRAPCVTPFEFYLELRELLGELAALHPDRDAFEAPPYDHESPAPVFHELAAKIRSLLRGAVAPSFMRVPFVLEEGLFTATLTDEQLTRPNAYFLGIRTKQDPRALAQLVEDGDRFKLMAKSMVERRIWGVKLTEERHPPLELPSEVGLHYFRLDRAAAKRMWERIEQERAIAIRWEGLEASDFEPTLYMTIPQGE